MSGVSQKVKAAKAAMSAKPKKEAFRQFLSTGSTPLNLACAGRVNGGFPVGHYIYLVGDSNSGKSYLTMTCLAEAALKESFDNYRFIYDGPEGGALMDISKHFGREVARRLESPRQDNKGRALHSRTVQEWFYNVDTALSNKQPCIYILDSMDALDTDEDTKKFKQRKKAFETGDDSKGSYGTSRAKTNSQDMRKILGDLQRTGSILIVISQTRDRIGFGAQFDPKTRSGGRALSFYACIEIWSSVLKKLRVRYKGNKKQVGIICKCIVKRSRVTGQENEVEFPIHWSTGIDDVGACVDFLCKWKHWKTKAGEDDDRSINPEITVSEWGLTMKRESLVLKIEQEKLQKDVRELVATVWREIEAAVAVKRERKYK